MVSAGFILLLIAQRRGQNLTIEQRHWPVLLFSSLTYLMIWNVASTYAAVLIPSGQAALLGFTMPFWATLITWLVWREPIGARMALALLLGLSSVAMLMWRNLQDMSQAPWGVVCGLLAAVGWAVGTVSLKRSSLGSAGIPATVLTGWQLLLAAIPVAGVALWRGVESGEPWFMPSLQSSAVILYITLVPVCLGNVAWFSIVGLLPAHVAGLSSIAVPMVAMLSGAWMHAEPLGGTQWLAMVLCAAGLTLVLPRQAKPTPPIKT